MLNIYLHGLIVMIIVIIDDNYTNYIIYDIC
jgi:hypothetical protein